MLTHLWDTLGRVYSLKDILTDQSIPFVSKLMGDMCQLLHVKHLRTSV